MHLIETQISFEYKRELMGKILGESYMFFIK